jgi:CSLREA domain-containing protein
MRVAAVALVGLAISQAALAAPTFTVSSTADAVDDDPGDGICHTAAGACTLRAAVMEANRTSGVGATIMLPTGIYTLVIPAAGQDDETTGDLNLTAPAAGNPTLTLQGAGAASTIIDGNQLDRVLEIDGGRTAQISGVTIRNGYTSGVGGGIDNVGILTLTASRVVDDVALAGGGGIYSANSLSMNRDTLSGDSAPQGGGLDFTGQYGSLAILDSTIDGDAATAGNGGGVFVTGDNTADVANSTITGNMATGDGGGIWAEAPLYVTNVTIYGNAADSLDTGAGVGGGIALGATTAGYVEDSILAGNTTSASLGQVRVRVGSECQGYFNPPLEFPFFLGGNNLLQSYDTTVCTMNGWRILADPLLGPLQDNGGTTETLALLPGSPAIDAGCAYYFGNDVLTTDQRGFPRPDPGGICDLGAYEVPEPGAAALELGSVGSLLLARRLRARTAAA